MEKLRKINIFIAILFVLFVCIFIVFFSMDEESLSKDIYERSKSSTELLAEKDIGGTKIILFSVGENKTGIANYVKIQPFNRYFCEDFYILTNSEGESEEISDVFPGAWNSYCVIASVKSIRVVDIDKFSGIYWVITYNLVAYCAIMFGCFMLIRIKTKERTK